MIPVWKACLLGAVQGFTEFLPVSSSAHLVIFQQYLGLSQSGAFLMAFDVALHFGTLCAILVVFQEELSWIFREKAGRKIGFYILLATIPAGVVGITLKDFFEIFFADVIPTSFFLILTGWVLWSTRNIVDTHIDYSNLQKRHAWLIGLAQVLAIFPGISRSGTTITAGLLLKLKPETAVKFSFLMAIPAIGGASIIEAPQLAVLEWKSLFPILLGVFTAFATGYVAIRWMFKLVANKKLHHFSWYCWIVGSFVFIKELFF